MFETPRIPHPRSEEDPREIRRWRSLLSRLLTRNVPAVTANYSASVLDYLILVTNPGGSDVTVTLPAVTGSKGVRITVKRLDTSGNNTVVSGGAATIDGGASHTLAAQNDAVTVVCDGSNWFVIGSY